VYAQRSASPAARAEHSRCSCPRPDGARRRVHAVVGWRVNHVPKFDRLFRCNWNSKPVGPDISVGDVQVPRVAVTCRHELTLHIERTLQAVATR
jgi:hypothetical protein